MSSNVESAPMPSPEVSVEAAKPKKGLWATILTSTPILLTVLATLLAGMSSSQMTQAMYWRSVAAQNEARGGNQWNFFAARRSRGVSMEMTLATLGARLESHRFRFADFRKDAEAQARAYRTAEQQSARLLKVVPEPVRAEAEAVHKVVAKLAQEAAAFPAKVGQAADRPFSEDDQKALEVADVPLKKVADVFPFLDGDRPLPFLAEEKEDIAKENEKRKEKNEKPLRLTVLSALSVAEARINPTIPAAVTAIRERKSEPEIARLMRRGAREQGGHSLKKSGDAELHKAVDLSEERGQKFDRLDGAIGDAGKSFGGLLAEQEKRARNLSAAVARVQAALPSDADSTPQAAAAALVAQTEKLRREAHEQTVGYRAARIDYDGRRYRREADYNQGTGYLRDVQSRLAEVHSDGHREASGLLFFGMLAAQAGVAVATFSLTLRAKGILWALASAAGITAVAIMASTLAGVMF